jgi:hypothetical protein
MFIEAIQYRIMEFNRLKRLKQQNEMNCPTELNEAIKANITAISLLVVISLILFISVKIWNIPNNCNAKFIF